VAKLQAETPAELLEGNRFVQFLLAGIILLQLHDRKIRKIAGVALSVLIAVFAPLVIVERHARTDDVQVGETVVQDPRLDLLDQEVSFGGEPLGHEGGAAHQGDPDPVDGGLIGHLAVVVGAVLPRGRGKLSLGQPVGAVVLADVEDVRVGTHQRHHFSGPDGPGIPVPADQHVGLVGIGHVRPHGDRRSAPVEGVNRVGVDLRDGFAAAADAADHVEFVGRNLKIGHRRLHGGRDGVVPASRAQPGVVPRFEIAPRELLGRLGADHGTHVIDPPGSVRISAWDA